MACATQAVRQLIHDLDAQEPVGEERSPGSRLYPVATDYPGQARSCGGGQSYSSKSIRMGREYAKNGLKACCRSCGGWTSTMHLIAADVRTAHTQAPQTQILFDAFNILHHLADAMDQVRRAENHRVAMKDRAFIKGQRYTVLSHRANLTLAVRRSSQKLLRASQWLVTIYLLKEEFGQIWPSRREGWARQFFTRRREQLKWQRRRLFETFATLIEKHWQGIVGLLRTRNKVKPGFVEGMNNKIRVIQQRVYGYRDEEYLRLKILTIFLPKQ